jgi:hypothetical protein
MLDIKSNNGQSQILSQLDEHDSAKSQRSNNATPKKVKTSLPQIW